MNLLIFPYLTIGENEFSLHKMVYEVVLASTIYVFVRTNRGHQYPWQPMPDLTNFFQLLRFGNKSLGN